MLTLPAGCSSDPSQGCILNAFFPPSMSLTPRVLLPFRALGPDYPISLLGAALAQINFLFSCFLSRLARQLFRTPLFLPTASASAPHGCASPFPPSLPPCHNCLRSTVWHLPLRPPLFSEPGVVSPKAFRPVSPPLYLFSLCHGKRRPGPLVLSFVLKGPMLLSPVRFLSSASHRSLHGCASATGF